MRGAPGCRRFVVSVVDPRWCCRSTGAPAAWRTGGRLGRGGLGRRRRRRPCATPPDTHANIAMPLLDAGSATCCWRSRWRLARAMRAPVRSCCLRRGARHQPEFPVPSRVPCAAPRGGQWPAGPAALGGRVCSAYFASSRGPARAPDVRRAGEYTCWSRRCIRCRRSPPCSAASRRWRQCRMCRECCGKGGASRPVGRSALRGHACPPPTLRGGRIFSALAAHGGLRRRRHRR